ncbi:DUF91 domain-containing protein [Rodentibacter trehalosifermentans]|uniref:DUF91 domain-containing protein n=2 Tax=Rodentibacter trehalosifermentans TaxID=1908263 RepID=A0A1V3IXY1_9PAST|nr:DUF91 domain-containing protein [Rodentibacter trehalosifermentans]OOF49640.1 DUF91 domain-containing protein [Rodentibacter trehalosifermentans]
MATTHVFIVNSKTFKIHLEYMFAGTGVRTEYIDFNAQGKSRLHHTTENNIVGMIADINRIRVDDFVIFYLQQSKQDNILEGKFYGIFRVASSVFLDNYDEKQYLTSELGKSLTFRVQIKPYEVYQEGITEWEALDEIKNIISPNQMLWSLIYRKLKGNRGNTMITIYEFERLRQLLRNKNNKNILYSDAFSFDLSNQKISSILLSKKYEGRKEHIDLLPRLLDKYHSNNQFEFHLQAYIIQKIEYYLGSSIEWIGNEVSCGVGMQRIDILISKKKGINRECLPIELKSTEAYSGITSQIQRYIDWLNQYYLPNHPSDLSPILISRRINIKESELFSNLINEFKSFNKLNKIKLRYIEFFIENEELKLEEYEY